MELEVHYERLVELFTGRARVTNLPPGSKVLDIYDRPGAKTVRFVVEHESFDEVGEYDAAPVRPAQFGRTARGGRTSAADQSKAGSPRPSRQANLLRRKREDRESKGLCSECDDPPEEGFKLCSDHLFLAAERNRRSRLRAKP